MNILTALLCIISIFQSYYYENLYFKLKYEIWNLTVFKIYFQKSGSALYSLGYSFTHTFRGMLPPRTSRWDLHPNPCLLVSLEITKAMRFGPSTVICIFQSKPHLQSQTSFAVRNHEFCLHHGDLLTPWTISGIELSQTKNFAWYTGRLLLPSANQLYLRYQRSEAIRGYQLYLHSQSLHP